MTEISLASRAAKTGQISRPFLAAMVAGTVLMAGGYAVISKGRGTADGGGAPGAAFHPETASMENSAPQVTVVKSASVAPKAASAKSSARSAAAKNAAKSVAPSAKSSVSPRVAAGSVAADSNVKPKRAPIVSVQQAVAEPAANPRLAQASPARAVAQAAVGEWPEYRGKLRDGISRETGWLGSNEAQIVWKANVGTGFSSIAVSGGRAYTMGNTNDQDTVWCFDATNGKVLWKYTYAADLFADSHEGGPGATPTVDGNLVFTYSKRGLLHALDAQSGRVVWSKNIPNDYGGQIPKWGITSSPVVHNNMLLVVAGAPRANVMAFDKTNGNVIWKNGNDGPGYAAPLIFRWQNTPYLAVFNASGIVFQSLTDGKELWRHPWKTAYDVNAAMPIVSGDRVFISSGYNTGAAMLQSSKDDALLWQNRNMRNHFNSSVLWDDYLYGFDESDLVCLDSKTGRKMWSQGRMGKGSLLASDGKLIILSERGELVIAEASPDRYREINRNQILSGKCWTMPALANGRIYARNASGDLVCVKF